MKYRLGTTCKSTGINDIAGMLRKTLMKEKEANELLKTNYLQALQKEHYYGIAQRKKACCFKLLNFAT
jgi:hypothetical protein